MAGFRELVINSINKSADLIPTQSLLRISGQKLILPYYHSISDNEMPHINQLYPVKGTKAFIKDLDFLLKFFEPIDYFTFQELATNHRKPKKPSFLLTFDDGLREFYDIIAPILLEKSIPAICFVNSGFVDNKDLFFRYKASLLINLIKSDPLVEKTAFDFLDKPKNVIQKILSIKYHEKHLLNNIAQLVDLSYEHFLVKKQPYLTSLQIKSLIQQGFHIGAHSVDHPEYQFINFEQQLIQTSESIKYISDNFSPEYKIFSFPFTDYKVSNEFFQYLNTEKIADFTFGCAGQKTDEIPNHYQRISLEMADLSARKIINSELLYYLIKFPFGKNKIKRK